MTHPSPPGLDAFGKRLMPDVSDECFVGVLLRLHNDADERLDETEVPVPRRLRRRHAALRFVSLLTGFDRNLAATESRLGLLIHPRLSVGIAVEAGASGMLDDVAFQVFPGGGHDLAAGVEAAERLFAQDRVAGNLTAAEWWTARPDLMPRDRVRALFARIAGGDTLADPTGDEPPVPVDAFLDRAFRAIQGGE